MARIRKMRRKWQLTNLIRWVTWHNAWDWNVSNRLALHLETSEMRAENFVTIKNCISARAECGYRSREIPNQFSPKVFLNYEPLGRQVRRARPAQRWRSLGRLWFNVQFKNFRNQFKPLLLMIFLPQSISSFCPSPLSFQYPLLCHFNIHSILTASIPFRKHLR